MNNNRGLWRGKRIDTGEWIDGHLIRPEFNQSAAYIGYLFATDDHDIDVAQVDPSTLGECVGFRDKNRILMFEGDVITYKSITGKTWVAKIIYSVNKCRFVQETSSGQTFEIARKYANCYEVIGNIHDNPELIHKG